METQNIEYKESWRDEYLKWICGFANAQGGTLYIGKNDKGEVVGLTDAKRLLEDIPNKVKNALGIIVGVDLMTEDGKKYIDMGSGIGVTAFGIADEAWLKAERDKARGKHPLAEFAVVRDARTGAVLARYEGLDGTIEDSKGLYRRTG